MPEEKPIDRIVFTGHAIRQMFERSISRDEVDTVVRSGESIMNYPEDRPYPSSLLLGFPGGRPLHVVMAFDAISGTGYIITTYEPDATLWNEDFKTRRPE